MPRTKNNFTDNMVKMNGLTALESQIYNEYFAVNYQVAGWGIYKTSDGSVIEWARDEFAIKKAKSVHIYEKTGLLRTEEKQGFHLFAMYNYEFEWAKYAQDIKVYDIAGIVAVNMSGKWRLYNPQTNEQIEWAGFSNDTRVCEIANVIALKKYYKWELFNLSDNSQINWVNDVKIKDLIIFENERLVSIQNNNNKWNPYHLDTGEKIDWIQDADDIRFYGKADLVKIKQNGKWDLYKYSTKEKLDWATGMCDIKVFQIAGIVITKNNQGMCNANYIDGNTNPAWPESVTEIYVYEKANLITFKIGKKWETYRITGEKCEWANDVKYIHINEDAGFAESWIDKKTKQLHNLSTGEKITGIKDGMGIATSDSMMSVLYDYRLYLASLDIDVLNEQKNNLKDYVKKSKKMLEIEYNYLFIYDDIFTLATQISLAKSDLTNNDSKAPENVDKTNQYKKILLNKMAIHTNIH